MVNVSNTVINQLGWVILAVASIYILSVYGEALRKNIGGRLSAVVRMVTLDVKTVIAAAVAVAGVIIAVINPLNFGAAVGGLLGWIAPVWAFSTTLIMSVTNILGLTDYSIQGVIIFAAAVGLVAFVLRQTGFMEELSEWMEGTKRDD